MEPKTKIHIKKGDTVKVLSGDDRGQTGKVLKVDVSKYRAFVEGVNMISKNTKPNAKTPQGGIIKKEASVHISNLMVVDGKGNATRIGRHIGNKDRLVRYSKKSGEEIK
jgi:large subunit ribosomal protein L24